MASRSLATFFSSSNPVSLLGMNSSSTSGLSFIRPSSSDSGVRPSGKVRNVSAMRRGTGGKSSFSGHVVTVFGCNGMLGRQICSRLGKHGHQIVLPYHKNHYGFRDLKVVGDLGQVLYTPFHLKDEESIRKAVKYSDVVINCIDKGYDTLNFTVEDALGHGPGVLAKISQEMGVDRFIQISSLNVADKIPPSVKYKDGARWFRAKTIGEKNVKAAFPNATVLRTSDQMGVMTCKFLDLVFQRDAFFRLQQPYSVDGGVNVLKMPIYGGDVVTAIMKCIDDPSTKGEIFQAYGEEAYWLSDLFKYTSMITEYKFLDNKEFVLVKGHLDKLVYKLKADRRKFPVTELERFTYSDRPLPNFPRIQDLGVKITRMMDGKWQKMCAVNNLRLDYDPMGFHDFKTVPLEPVDFHDINVQKLMKFGTVHGIETIQK